MAKFPTFSELQAWPEFLQTQRYLRACLPDHPRFPNLPSLVAAFKSHDDSDEPPEHVWPSTCGQGTDNPSECVTPSQKLKEDKITPALIEELIGVWILSVAQKRAETALLGAGGLYMLNMPAAGQVRAEPLETVLNHPEMREVWGPEEVLRSFKMPVEVTSLSPHPEPAKAAGNEVDSSAQLAKIRSKLTSGKRLYLCHTGAEEIFPELAALTLHSFDLPRPDFDLVYGLHCLLYPKRRRLSQEAFAPLESLEGFSVADLALALCYDESLSTPQMLTRLIESRQITATTTDQSPSLEDLVGNRAVVELGLQIKNDFETWKAGDLAWPDLPNGVLLSGPPGCGKTLFASALARSLNAKLFKVSYADCAAGHNRGSSGIIEQLLSFGRKAAASKRAVLFIDEIDGFGLSRFAEQDHNSSYFRVITTSLLRFCDDMRKAPGVILIAASNDLDAVDPALIRAGRFDHHIALTRPRLVDVETLLTRELPTLPEPDITNAAQRLLGSSFAEIDAAARSVKAHARAQERPPQDIDLTAILDNLVPDYAESEVDLQRIALHESGHVLVSFLQSKIVPSKVVLSHLSSSVTRSGLMNFTQARLNDELTMLLAGRAAERLILGDVGSGSGAGSDSDLARATHLALSARCRWHLPTDSDLVWQDVSLKPSPLIGLHLRKEISLLLRARERAAYDLLSMHKPALLKFAETLLEVREMDRSEIRHLLQKLIPDSAEPDQPPTNPRPGVGHSSQHPGL